MVNEKRLKVIELSIFIERAVAATISSLLDINLKESKTLGNKSSSFSFKQKLDLLTDINALEKSSITKFQIFAEIRNQFAHNFEVHDFTTCLNFLDGTETFLRKTYSDKELLKLPPEDLLHALYEKLFEDVLNQVYKLLEKVNEKFIKIGQEEGTKQVYESVIKIMKEYTDSDDEFRKKYDEIILKAESELQVKQNNETVKDV